MGSLIAFELKKILSKRVMQISLGVILAMLCYIVFFNITSQYANNPDEVAGELEGSAAIAQIEANATSLAGPITDERATEVLREYKSFIDPDGEIKEEYRADRSTLSANVSQYWGFISTHGAYVSLLTRPWMQGFQMPASVAATIDTSQTVDLYGQIRAKVALQLEDSDSFTYTDAEKDLWMSKLGEVSTPIEYGYAGGWMDFLDLVQYLIFAMLAVVIACAPMFNIEYRDRTDAVLLSTKYGKTRLGKAKVIAALIVSSAIYWFMALFLLVIPLIFFGGDGAELKVQIWSITNAYGLSLCGASLICCFIGYMIMLGLLGIVLALSARIKSSMGILAAGVAVVMIPLFVPNLHNNIANHMLFLFPYHALDPRNLFDMVSFSIGPVVIEYPIMLALLYLLLFVAGSLVAMRGFSRHQVG